MHKESKMVMDLLKKRKYEIYYIGGKCRVELHNEFHPESKIEIKDIDLVTNATPEEIKKVFPRSNIRGESFQVVAVNFGGFEFEIATYRKDLYDMNEVKKNKKITKPKTEVVTELDDDRSRRDFTINAVAQDSEGKYLDFTYKYHNKKISAIQDIKSKLIRAIGNPRQRFEEDPVRIIRAFRFMSQLGYEIEKQTLKFIESNLKLIEKIPHERIALELNKLILGQNAAETLILMKKIGLFKLKIFNSLKQEKNVLLPGIEEIDNNHFLTLNLFNKENTLKSSNTIIEAWTILLKPLGADKMKINLESVYPLSTNDIEKVEWLIRYFDLINSVDIRNDIYKARTGIVWRYKLMCMKDLLKMLCNIHLSLYGPDFKAKGEALINAFCSRPYFPEQLKVDGNQLMEIANEKSGPWINSAKEKLLYKLINTKKFPKEESKYMELVSEAVEEALTEETMKQQGLI